jgi:hypothetical protein
MEFDEMKKIWDTQNNQPPYVIDEKALQNRLQRKKHSFFVNIGDWLLIISNIGVIILLVGRHPFTPGANIFLYLEAVWTFATVGYLVVSLILRIKASRRFDRSIHGDLNHAIYLISYQMRISQITSWNLLPMGAILIFSGWVAGKLFMVSAVILVVDTLAIYAASKIYQINKRRKRALQVLKEKLENSTI